MSEKEEQSDITVFAETNFHGKRRKFGIRTDDRRRHMYLLGKTGMGKSTMLENMVFADIAAGRGVGVVDPHGDLADKILNFIPSNRVNDVIYFDPSDVEYPIAFNILETVDETHKHLVASGLMGVFKKIWPDVWSPRMEYILNNAVLALLDYPGSTMLGINRMLSDKDYRKKVIRQIKDPIVKAFWVDEFASYSERFAVEAVAAIQNKVGQFLSVFLVRNIIGQVKSTIDMRDIMDNNKILIMNLAKGKIGEDNSKLLGGLLVTRLQLAAMERVDIPEEQRQDFYLYVDEFQNYATESFANILSEARKYRLDLIMAHQYIEQLDETVAAAVFGNVGTMVIFRIGAADAEVLLNEFTPRFTEEDLVNLTKYDIYLKLMINGVSSDAFSATSLAPVGINYNTKKKVIKVSRERYAKPRAVVEDKITRWASKEMGGDDEKGEQEKSVRGSDRLPDKKVHIVSARGEEERKPSAPVFQSICDNCGNIVRTSFELDKNRPIYCKECLKKVKGEKAEGVKKPLAPIKVESMKAEPVKAKVLPVSLSDALKQGPVSFRSGLPTKPVLAKPAPEKKISFSPPPTPAPAPRKVQPVFQENKLTPQAKFPPITPKVPVNKPVEEKKTATTQLKPGEVVKF